MRIIITEHAKKRLRELRQDRISAVDIERATGQIPGTIPSATRFRGFVSRSGRAFDLVAKDIPAGRLVITIIGK
ncbi:MAG TPA: hypothetical protein VHQ46_06700 [Desulfobacteria bacterium]|nr:hypothetical protein [Desulfobacteria bacterium]